MTFDERERLMLIAALDILVTSYPMIRDLIDPAAQLSIQDMADIRALRVKIGGAL